MILKIEFVYSKEYDNIFRELGYLSNISGNKYISDKIDIQKYIDKEIKPQWEIYGNTILQKWQKYESKIGLKKIYLCIIGIADGLRSGTSKPMTITIRKKS